MIRTLEGIPGTEGGEQPELIPYRGVTTGGLLTTFGGSQEILVLRAWQPAVARPAAQEDVVRQVARPE